MKPAPFDYIAAASVAEAVEALAARSGDAKLLAGGQSLVPMLNFRLLSPALLIDINRIPGLDYIEPDDDGLRIGALVRHYTLETSALVAERFPMLSAAMRHVAHLAIRNRGTIGGSLSHADPSAELPLMALLLEARIACAGPAGARRIAAEDFFLGALTTALGEHEMVTEVALPALIHGTGWGFEEFARRSGDFALAAAAATVSLAGGAAAEVRIAVTGMGERPERMAAAEARLKGAAYDPEAIRAASELVAQAVAPSTDLHASADYRRHLAGVLSRRALAAAWRRARGALQ